MTPLAALWLPIVVAAVLVFVASALAHMVLTYHKRDYKQIPGEQGAIAGLRDAKLAPGYYVFPYCANPKEMSSPEMQKRYADGPIGMMAILPNGQPNIGKNLGTWFAYCVVVSVFVAYIAGHALEPGAAYLAVFRFAGAAAFMAYGLGNVVDSIWKGFPWANSLRAVVDGLLYSLVTGGAFGWLWPH